MRALVVILTVVAAVASAAAEGRIVVASSDPGFPPALEEALAPTGVHVVAVADPPPPADALAAAARRIAERETATAAVWLIGAGDRATLVAYERDGDRVLVREVPYAPPLRSEQAAEVARMARTMLRALREPVPEPTPGGPVPRVTAGRGGRRAAARGPGAPRLAIWAAGDVRAGELAGGTGVVGRLGAAWRPDAIGVGLEVGLAARRAVETPSFLGQAADDAAAIVVHAPVWRRGGFRALALGGAALHVCSLEGSARGPGGGPVSLTRLDPALRLGFAARYVLGRHTAAGIEVSADTLLRGRRYEADSKELLVAPRVQLAAGLVLAVRL